MVRVVDVLREEHRNFSRVLEILTREIALFEKTEEPDYDLIEKIVDYLRSFPDAAHHPKEDLLYQKLWERDSETADLMGNLQAEHLKLAALVAHFSETLKNVLLDSEQPRGNFVVAGEEFIDFYRSHIMLEELRFFPAALRALSHKDWNEIEQALTNTEDPLFGNNIQAPYTDLKAQIFEIATENRI